MQQHNTSIASFFVEPSSKWPGQTNELKASEALPSYLKHK